MKPIYYSLFLVIVVCFTRDTHTMFRALPQLFQRVKGVAHNTMYTPQNFYDSVEKAKKECRENFTYKALAQLQKENDCTVDSLLSDVRSADRILRANRTRSQRINTFSALAADDAYHRDLDAVTRTREGKNRFLAGVWGITLANQWENAQMVTTAQVIKAYEQQLQEITDRRKQELAAQKEIWLQKDAAIKSRALVKGWQTAITVPTRQRAMHTIVKSYDKEISDLTKRYIPLVAKGSSSSAMFKPAVENPD